MSETHCVPFPLVKTASTVAPFLRFAPTRARKAFPFVAMGFLLIRVADHVHDGHFSEAAIEAVRRFAALRPNSLGPAKLLSLTVAPIEPVL